MTSKELCQILYNTKFSFHDEKGLQRGVGLVLDRLGLEYRAEFPLTKKDRIDFLVGEFGIECKTSDSSGGTSLSSVTRQIHRYCQSDSIKEIILLTTLSKHRALPESMNNKPIYVVHLMMSVL